MVNCNPETVSTDYDTSDRLYFEPLTAEDVLELIAVEQTRGELLGVIVQFGGQTPLKLAAALESAGIPILGTSPDAIDLAEDRERFQEILKTQLASRPTAPRSGAEAEKVAAEIGYPVVIRRPTCWAGGRWKSSTTNSCAATSSRRSRSRAKPGPGRFLPAGRHRGGRGRARRRDRRLRRRHHAAHRGSGDSFATGVSRRRIRWAPRSWPNSPARPNNAGARLERRRADEHPPAIKTASSTSWRSTRAPAARCPSSPRRPMCPSPLVARVMAVQKLAAFAQGHAPAAALTPPSSGLPVRPLPGRRRDPGARDEIDRHGPDVDFPLAFKSHSARGCPRRALSSRRSRTAIENRRAAGPLVGWVWLR